MELFRTQPSTPSQTQENESSSSLRNDNALNPATALFREIHKNDWLRRVPFGEKRSGAIPKKGERVWAVFCVHDDIQPFLELYGDQKMAAAHKPDWFVSLNTTIHVSPTIVAQEQEYEFVVTLTSDVVRLTAPSWDTMMEWVDTIRTKLREMKILCPRENVYSRLPEPRLPLLPTRDPNSPLPPPPTGPSAFVPGIEPVHTESTNGPANTATSNHSIASDVTSRTQPGSYINLPSPVPTAEPISNERSSSSPLPPTAGSSSRREGEIVTPLRSNSSAAMSRNTILNRSTELSSGLRSSETPPGTPSNNFTSAGSSEGQSSDRDSSNNIVNENVTVIEVPNSCTTPRNVFQFNFPPDGHSENGVEENFFTPPVTPRSQQTTLSVSQVASNNVSPSCSSPSRLWHQITHAVSNLMGQADVSPVPQQSEVIRVAQGITNITIPSQSTMNQSASSSVYEHVYPTGHTRSAREDSRREGTNPLPAEILSETTERVQGPEIPTSRVQGETNLRNSAIPEPERRFTPTPHSLRQCTSGIEVTTGTGQGQCITLREQQVQQLRKEMLHPGGVRLQLRRKDCTNSIALVDAFGAVWVAGWKQREHPMLYNALHIGDQLLSAAGLPVQCSSDAQRFIKSCASLYVEFVIKRLPFGRVFALRRDADGQSLGIVTEGGTAEIKHVMANSPAAKGGLTNRAPTCDGLSLTSWVLTEVNGRPINLFFKAGEVHDRLNAVGKEISVLVQPCDLIKQIKKQFKAIRSYKEYIVQ